MSGFLRTHEHISYNIGVLVVLGVPFARQYLVL